MNEFYKIFTMIRTLLLNFLLFTTIYAGPEEDEGVKYANKCEGNFYLM